MEEQTKKEKEESDGSLSIPVRGIALALICGLSFSLSTVVVKYLKNIHPGELTAYKFWCVCSLIFPQIVWKQEEILGPRGHRISTLIMGFANATAIFFMFLAARYLPLAEATVLYTSCPVFVPIAAKIFLKETFGILHVFAVFATITGLILTTGLQQAITENSFTTENLYGIAAGLGAVAAFTTFYISRRKTKKVHSSVVLLIIGIVGIVESVILTFILGNFTFKNCGIERGLIIFMGLISYLAQFCSVTSLRYLEAGSMTIVKSSSALFFAFVWQLVIFRVAPQLTTICGAVLVCISIILLGVGQKYRAVGPRKCLNMS